MVQGRTREDGTWEYSPGARITLKLFALYAQYGLAPWTHLHVVEAHPSCYVVQTDAKTSGKPVKVLEVARVDVDQPIGWQKVYTTTQEHWEDLQRVKAWIQSPEGCLVAVSLYLEHGGRLSFLKGSEEGKSLGSLQAIEVVRDLARFKFKHVLVAHTKPTEKGWTYDRHWREWHKEVAVSWDDL